MPDAAGGATGVQMLGRTVVSLLRTQHDLHEADRAAYLGPWPTAEHDGDRPRQVSERALNLLP